MFREWKSDAFKLCMLLSNANSKLFNLLGVAVRQQNIFHTKKMLHVLHYLVADFQNS